ncbi:MAG: hypothetical protein WA324_00200 [Bryobacteraceae bacterium]
MLADLLCLVIFAPAILAAQSIDVADAKAAFAQAKQLSDKDAGHLWGIPLYGPMIFASPVTHEAVANQADGSGVLHETDGVWTGTLPANVMIANTAFWWGGKHWTMVMWPLSSSSLPRGRLLAHEMYHRLQDDLRLPAKNPQNPQLDTLDGRYWLQLEWKALALALISHGSEQQQAISDASAFRARRHTILAGTAESERQLEMNEGLAEYTGYALYAPDAASARWRLVNDLVNPQAQTFVRSFAYLSGPAYGLLLDERMPKWRSTLNAASDLGAMLGATVVNQKQLSADARSKEYGGAVLRITEEERAATAAAEQAKYRQLLVDGPVLVLPSAGHFNFGFNPNNVVALPGYGNVYPTFHVSDDWGKLEVEGGALMNDSYSMVTVSAPKSTTVSHISGDGWNLDLAAGWHIVPGKRGGDFTIAKN